MTATLMGQVKKQRVNENQIFIFDNWCIKKIKVVIMA